MQINNSTQEREWYTHTHSLVTLSWCLCVRVFDSLDPPLLSLPSWCSSYVHPLFCPFSSAPCVYVFVYICIHKWFLYRVNVFASPLFTSTPVSVVYALNAFILCIKRIYCIRLNKILTKNAYLYTVWKPFTVVLTTNCVVYEDEIIWNQ